MIVSVLPPPTIRSLSRSGMWAGAAARGADRTGDARRLAAVFKRAAFIPASRTWIRRGCFQTPISLSASPAAARLASFISEYLRERITPAAPEVNAALTAALTSEGCVFFSL
jgi:hypothetical protein